MNSKSKKASRIVLPCWARQPFMLYIVFGTMIIKMERSHLLPSLAMDTRSCVPTHTHTHTHKHH